jgi:hypothetical protein
MRDWTILVFFPSIIYPSPIKYINCGNGKEAEILRRLERCEAGDL